MGIFGNLFKRKKDEPAEAVEPKVSEAAEPEAADEPVGPAESNEIDNRELKQNLADAAISMMAQGKDYEELAGTKCQFGYLFHIRDHGLEALFKITTDRTTAYFAAQKTSLMRVNLNEELFKSTTETFLSMHK